MLVLSNSPRLTKVNANDSDFMHRRADEHLLEMTADRLEMESEGKTQPCASYLLAKGFQRGDSGSTSNRTDKKLGRVFVDFSGPKAILSVSGTRYFFIVNNDYSRYTWINVLKHKSDVGSAFRRFLTDVHADGVPYQVEIVGSDN